MFSSSETIAEFPAEKIKAGRTIEVCAPASTSNLGPGFDCCGLALKLYLSVNGTVLTGAGEDRIWRHSAGEERNEACAGDDLIYGAMRFVAQREGAELPRVHLDIRADIPFASGLGSSGAAIVAGICLGSAICELNLTPEKMLRYG